MTKLPPGSDDAEASTSATAVLYVRVSTKDQAERDGDPDGYSIPAQLEACRRKAAAIGAIVIDEFVDRDIQPGHLAVDPDEQVGRCGHTASLSGAAVGPSARCIAQRSLVVLRHDCKLS